MRPNRGPAVDSLAADENQRLASLFRSRLDEMRRALEESTDFQQVKDLHTQTVHFLSYLRTSPLGPEVLYRGAELKLRVERKMGQILEDLHLAGGNHKSNLGPKKLTLALLGISRKKSALWQAEAGLPEEDFDLYIQRSASEGKVPSSNGLCCLARVHAERAKFADTIADPFGHVADGLRSLSRQGKPFGCIYVDPPSTPAGGGRACGFHIDARLAELPLIEVAAPKAHLYLKVTPRSKEEGVMMLRDWGFSLKAWLLRREVPLDPHDSLQSVHQMWLLGVRNGSGRHNQGLPRWVEEAGMLTIDSTEAIYRCIERVSPPPYLDLFGSRPFSNRWMMATA
ncbi:MAG: hypothetical protein ACLP9L_06860 [Thermoguttaceae bacterium]